MAGGEGGSWDIEFKFKFGPEGLNANVGKKGRRGRLLWIRELEELGQYGEIGSGLGWVALALTHRSLDTAIVITPLYDHTVRGLYDHTSALYDQIVL